MQLASSEHQNGSDVVQRAGSAVGTLAPMRSMLGTLPTPATFLAMGVSTIVGGMVSTVMP